MNTIILFLLLITFFGNVLCQKKVLLSEVNTLTLRDGQLTTGHRTKPTNQLRCIYNVAPCKNLPSVVQCYNKGSDGMAIQWRCEAQLAKNVIFDTVQVSCEGYDNPNDPWILAGSCYLTYSLRVVGRHRHGHRRHRHRHSDWQLGHGLVKHHLRTTVSPLVTVLLGLAAFAVVLAMLGLAFRLLRCRGVRYHRVYSAEAGPPQPPPAYGYHGGGGSSGPGFWSGAAMGGLTGYMMGAASSAEHHHHQYHHAADVGDFGDVGGGYSSDDDDGGGVATAVGFGSTWNR